MCIHNDDQALNQDDIGRQGWGNEIFIVYK